MTPLNVIQPPKGITLSGDVAALLQQVDENAERLNERRPFSRETEMEVRKAFLPDRVTATLNIEGIAATRRQTLAIMDAMVISQNPAKEDQEILNALKADGFVYNQYEDGADLDARMIREINRLLLDKIKDEAGNFRRRGQIHRCARHKEMTVIWPSKGARWTRTWPEFWPTVEPLPLVN